MYIPVTEEIKNNVLIGCLVGEFQRYILGSLDQPILETKTACYGLDLLNVDIRDPVTDMSANGYIDSQTVSG